MSILIKGMEMPANCFLCPLSVLNGERLFCEVTKEEVIRAKRSSCCPLVPVPPHGRLGDLDALMQHEVLLLRDGGRLPIIYASYVRNAPTIIPAEEGET